MITCQPLSDVVITYFHSLPAYYRKSTIRVTAHLTNWDLCSGEKLRLTSFYDEVSRMNIFCAKIGTFCFGKVWNYFYFLFIEARWKRQKISFFCVSRAQIFNLKLNDSVHIYIFHPHSPSLSLSHFLVGSAQSCKPYKELLRALINESKQKSAQH